MLSFEEALARMLASARPMTAEPVDLDESLGRILAADVTSDMDLPPFDKAAMDGYACRRADLTQGELDVIEELPAGKWPTRAVVPGTCARILTGAPVPEGADCVLMQEQVERTDQRIRILDARTATNICVKGEDVRRGDLVLHRGERVSAAHIAVLASVGTPRPLVARRPRVTVFATGSELVEPTERPSLSQIRNSNGWQLLAQLRGMGVSARYGGLLRDELAVVREATERAASESDLVLLSGGASTGDLDFVPSALRELGVVLAFESIAMQPGRPTLFGVRDATYFCALPGNPVSTFVVFELMLKPFLFRLMGHEYEPPMTEARLMKPLRRKNTKRRASVPVRLVAPGQVEPVDYHGSAHISALTRAAGLVVLPVGHVGYEEGATVHVRPFSP